MQNAHPGVITGACRATLAPVASGHKTRFQAPANEFSGSHKFTSEKFQIGR